MTRDEKRAFAIGRLYDMRVGAQAKGDMHQWLLLETKNHYPLCTGNLGLKISRELGLGWDVASRLASDNGSINYLFLKEVFEGWLSFDDP